MCPAAAAAPASCCCLLLRGGRGSSPARRRLGRPVRTIECGGWLPASVQLKDPGPAAAMSRHRRPAARGGAAGLRSHWAPWAPAAGRGREVPACPAADYRSRRSPRSAPAARCILVLAAPPPSFRTASVEGADGACVAGPSASGWDRAPQRRAVDNLAESSAARQPRLCVVCLGPVLAARAAPRGTPPRFQGGTPCANPARRVRHPSFCPGLSQPPQSANGASGQGGPSPHTLPVELKRLLPTSVGETRPCDL